MLRNNNIDARAALNPTKLGRADVRLFFDDFDGTTGTDLQASPRPGWGVVESAAAGTVLLGELGTAVTNGVVTITGGSGAVAASVAFATESLWNGPCEPEMRAVISMPAIPTAAIAVKYGFGFTYGTTYANFLERMVGAYLNSAAGAVGEAFAWRIGDVTGTAGFLQTSIPAVAGEQVSVSMKILTASQYEVTINGHKFIHTTPLDLSRNDYRPCFLVSNAASLTQPAMRIQFCSVSQNRTP